MLQALRFSSALRTHNFDMLSHKAVKSEPEERHSSSTLERSKDHTRVMTAETK